MFLGFPGSSDGQESACNVGDQGSIPGLRRSPGRGHGNPLRYSCLENPRGQKSLAGYSPWSHKESDVTKHSTFSSSSLLEFRNSILCVSLACIKMSVWHRDTRRMFHEWMNKKIKWGYKAQDREITRANLTNNVTFKSPLDLVPKWWTKSSLYKTFKKYTLPSFAEEFFPENSE